jgi:adenine-specific DNA-methyltransferase
MERLKMESFDVVGNHVSQIAALFPHCVTERLDKDGKPVRAVDFEKLREELTGEIIEEGAERYQFTWPDKRKANQLANTPTKMTLRPCREESVDFDHTENLYIEGDNLDVLKVIREAYLGKVKMIYIDPPYNTGNDFVYNDDFASSYEEFAESCKVYDEEGNLTFDPKANGESNGRFHTDWLNMIYPRLKVARDLLSEDGVIFISIDDSEIDNLRKICNEIYGERNFVANIVWQSTAGSNTGTDIVSVTENIIVYTKNRTSFEFDGMIASDKSYVLSDEYEKERGKYSLDKLDRRRVGNHYSEALNYPIEMPDGTLRYPGGYKEKSSEGWNYLWSQTKVKWGIENGFIEFKQSNGEWSVYNKRYAKIDNSGNEVERTIPFRNLILSEQCNTAQGTAEIRTLFDSRPFDFPKPSELIKHLMSTAVRRSKDSIILDFFSGSATTAHAVMKLNAEDGGNRKFIMVQLPEVTDEKSEARKVGYQTICEIGKERIRRAGRKVKEEAGLQGQHLDIGFRVLKLAESNMEDVYYTPDQFEMKDLFRQADNVKPDRTGMDLLFQVMLQCGCLLSEKITVSRIGGKEVFNVADGYLIACFDKDVSEDVIAEIAKQQPVYFVMRDASAASDNVMDNFDQLFRHYSPDTIRRII